ncbi:hypothetical protein [Tsuneonella sp. HG222]
MAKRGRNDGLTIGIVPHWQIEYPKEDAKRDTSDLQQIMLEHDRIRAEGRDPMSELKAAKKLAKKAQLKKRKQMQEGKPQ